MTWAQCVEGGGVMTRLSGIFRTFMGIEDRSVLVRQTGILAVAALLYRQLDWILVALTASLVAILKYHHVSHLNIFLLLWMGNLLLSWGVIVCSQKVQVDFTLSNGWRRLVNRAAGRSRSLGWALEAGFIMGISLWAGAGPLYIFLREKIPSRSFLVFLLFAVSGIQMALWAGFFVLGYDSLSSLLAAVLPEGRS